MTAPSHQFPQINVQTDSETNIDLTYVIISLLNNPVFTNVIASVLTPVLTQSLSVGIKDTVDTAIRDTLRSLEDKIEAQSARIDKN